MINTIRICTFASVKFLSALAADGTIPDVEGIISSNLSAGFDSLKESVTSSIATQEKVMAAVQVCAISSLKQCYVVDLPHRESSLLFLNVYTCFIGLFYCKSKALRLFIVCKTFPKIVVRCKQNTSFGVFPVENVRKKRAV